jgi:integrase
MSKPKSSVQRSGIVVIHSRRCPKSSRNDLAGACDCKPVHEAWVWDAQANKKIRKRFDTPSGAKHWHEDAVVALRQGALRAPTATTIRSAAERLVDGMRDGSILSRSRKPYKPSTCRDYERILNQHILCDRQLANRKLGAVRWEDMQAFVDYLREQGLSPSTVHNILDPLRVIFHRARREIAVNPMLDLELPAVSGRRERIEPSTVAVQMIEMLPDSEQAFWAVALFVALRRGELRALRVLDIDFDEDVINVCRGWDPVEGIIDLKSEAGHRSPPMAGIVREKLRAHIMRTGRRGEDFVFGRTATGPFYPSTVRARAMTAWGWRQTCKRVPGLTKGGNPKTKTEWIKAREDAIEPLSPHEARHCAITYFIQAGFTLEEARMWAGHADIRMTIRYTHVQKDAQKAAKRKLDAFINQGGMP